MSRSLRWFVPMALLTACGDLKFDETPTSPNASPPGSTTSTGTVAANISGEQFFGRLTAPATVAGSRLNFTAYDGFTRQLTISVAAPGPGTFDVGGPYSPSASLIQDSAEVVRRWVSPSTAGFGYITLTFLTADVAIGNFTFIMLPDSATIASGTTTRRSATVGTFNVLISR